MITAEQAKELSFDLFMDLAYKKIYHSARNDCMLKHQILLTLPHEHFDWHKAKKEFEMRGFTCEMIKLPEIIRSELVGSSYFRLKVSWTY